MLKGCYQNSKTTVTQNIGLKASILLGEEFH